MKEETKKIRKILNENKDKRILILGVHYTGKSIILQNLGYGENYDKLYEALVKEKYGYLYGNTISSAEHESFCRQIVVKPGIPMFSSKIIDCDLVIFLYINAPLLRLKAAKNYENGGSLVDLQENLRRQLNHLEVPVIKIEVLPKKIYPEKMGRKVYICGDKDKRICIEDKREQYLEYYEKEGRFLVRFPFLYWVDSLEELKRKQGFLLIVYEHVLPKTMYEIDKKYRKIFNRFKMIFVIVDDESKGWKKYKYANITFIGRTQAEDAYFDEIVMEEYYDYLVHWKEVKFSEKKKELLEKMYIYLQNKNFIKTEKIMKTFSLSSRQVQRYMNDLNLIYRNIGYDYVKNEWYVI